jgi:hypothetical protein
MHVCTGLRIQGAINIVYNKEININKKNRNKFVEIVDILKKSNIHAADVKRKVLQLENKIKNYDNNILNDLNLLIDFNDTYEFIIYNSKDGIKTEKINSNSSWLEKISFRIKKIFINDYNLLNSVFQSANDIAKENPVFKDKIIQSLDNLKKIRKSQPEFFASSEAIERHARLTKEINQILDLSLTPQKERTIQEVIINQGKSFLEKLTVVQRFQNLTGMSISSTVAPDNENAIIDQGGFGIFTTTKEETNLKDLLTRDAANSPLTPQEKVKVKHYLDDLEQSRNLNYMIAAMIAEDNEEGERVVAKVTSDQILHLQEGQSVFMDVGYLGHSMRAQFLKKGNKIEINLFDTSGALELWVSKNPFLSAIHYFLGQKEYITLSTSVSVGEFEEKGRSYLEQVIAMQSKNVEEIFKEKSNYLRYMAFIRVFQSINLHGKLQTRQVVQNSNNCYAQRIHAAEAHCLGSSIHKKVSIHSLNQIQQELWGIALEELNTKEITRLEELLKERRILTPSELKDICNHLNRMEEYPQTVEDWYPIFALLRHNILKKGVEST